LFEAVTRQLDARSVVMLTGTLVDATLILSASIRRDTEARGQDIVAASRCTATRRMSRRIRTPRWSAMSRSRPANIHDATELAAILPEAPGDTYGDSAFAGSKPEAAIRASGGRPHVVHTGTWGGPEALARLQAHNAEVRRVRARIEKVFGTAKRSYGLRRMRWLGLAKAGLQVRLTAIAYNLRRSWRLLSVAAT
jgi:IS5 family transposase